MEFAMYFSYVLIDGKKSDKKTFYVKKEMKIA